MWYKSVLLSNRWRNPEQKTTEQEGSVVFCSLDIELAVSLRPYYLARECIHSHCSAADSDHENLGSSLQGVKEVTEWDVLCKQSKDDIDSITDTITVYINTFILL